MFSSNHPGVLEMFKNMETWEDKDEYLDADRDPWEVNGETAGYLTSAGNLRMVVMRNAGHMAPRNQPKNSLEMFTQFLDGDL